jgi:DNA primase
VAGRIQREDVQAVRERARIEEVVGEHVTLKTAGVGSMKGLCPFHDERSPSFHVRPLVGLWHCFGCGEGGDVFSFLQKIDGLGFTEAVEYLAGRVGITLRYEEGGGPRSGEEVSKRQRLLEAHRVAETFFAEQLSTPAGAAGRAFLAERGFDRAAAEQFGVGYAPKEWDALLRHLRGRGFTEPELTATGLMSPGARGQYDRFRGRLMWPIREVTGDTIGFGARRLFDDDQGPKYLNTPETAIYHKAHVLYGLDLAKREIVKAKQIVVVEGYTDVMAAHLSGVPTAVATCGTAFGPDHTRIVRRLVGDSGTGAGVQLASGASVGGEIIFLFDGDAAGQKAAMRAFGEDQSFSAQTFVAVEPNGMDPCELRQAKGPEAVGALVASRQPLFEFVIRTALKSYDLRTAEGRVGALRVAAPVVAGIRDTALRPEYTRMLGGWLGMDQETVSRAVKSATQGRPGAAATDPRARPGPGQAARGPQPDLRDPVVRIERTALEVALQHPQLVPVDFDALGPDACVVPAHRAVHEAILAAGGLAVGRASVAQTGSSAAWVEQVRDAASAPVDPLVTELAVAPLPEDRPEALGEYVRSIAMKLVDVGLTRKVAEAKGRLQRMDADADPDAYGEAFALLIELEGRRRELRNET